MEFQVVMVRTYETMLVYEADSFEEAAQKAEADQAKYHVELEQCCVVEEYFKEA